MDTPYLTIYGDGFMYTSSTTNSAGFLGTLGYLFCVENFSCDSDKIREIVYWESLVSKKWVRIYTRETVDNLPTFGSI